MPKASNPSRFKVNSEVEGVPPSSSLLQDTAKKLNAINPKTVF